MADGRANVCVGAFLVVYLDGLGYEGVQIIQVEKLGVPQLAVLRIAPGQLDKTAHLIAEEVT